MDGSVAAVACELVGEVPPAPVPDRAVAWFTDTRIKIIKCQMYGRADFGLSRKRVLLASSRSWRWLFGSVQRIAGTMGSRSSLLRHASTAHVPRAFTESRAVAGCGTGPRPVSGHPCTPSCFQPCEQTLWGDAPGPGRWARAVRPGPGGACFVREPGIAPSRPEVL